MTSRYDIPGDEEKNNIQAQFEVSRAVAAIGDFEERIESLHSLGRISDKDHKEILGLIKTIKAKIGKIGKK